jgi:hypothetical protein
MLPKIFVIGFNKCGTTSLHKMFRRAGLASSHYRHHGADGSSAIIAEKMDQNARKGLPLLDGIADATAYSDMDMCQKRSYLSGIGQFRLLDRQYPGSRFILNTRDPENWLNSRCRHFDGGYLRRAMAQAGVRDMHEMRAIWRLDWHAHHAALQVHFATRRDQFLIFDIERDDPKTLCAFLPEYGLKPGQWRHHNRTPEEYRLPDLALAC